jgi:hypothetical protein
MKPSSSISQRWLMAATIVRRIAGVSLLGGCALLAWALVDVARPLPPQPAQASAAQRPKALATGRPALIAAIAARPLRQGLAEKAIQPTAVAVQTPALPSPPAVEVVATFVNGGEARAFVRRPEEKSLTAWTIGSREGIYSVTAVGDGWLTLEGAGIQHTLHVIRRGQ